jgi:hypothetical protein
MEIITEVLLKTHLEVVEVVLILQTYLVPVLDDCLEVVFKTLRETEF